MPLRLDSQGADFSMRFCDLLSVKREAAQDVEQIVRAIITEVMMQGDRALIALTAKFDRIDLANIGLRVSTAEIQAAEEACDARALAALRVVVVQATSSSSASPPIPARSLRAVRFLRRPDRL